MHSKTPSWPNLRETTLLQTATVEGANHPTRRGRVHFWLRITSIETGKSIYVDDGFGSKEGHFVHTVRPIQDIGYVYDWYVANSDHRREDVTNIPSVFTGNIEHPKREPTIPCFLAGTLVHCVDSLRTIESVQKGELVWSFDLKSRTWKHNEVESVNSHLFTGTVVQVQFGSDSISSTDHHPFWVISGKGLSTRPDVKVRDAYLEKIPEIGRWVSAVDLQVSDMVVSRLNSIDVVVSVKSQPQSVNVYNLSVVNARNFTIGKCGILCHNT